MTGPLGRGSHTGTETQFSMIVMTLEIKTPRMKREEIIDTLRQITRPTEARAGCLGCCICQDLHRMDTLTYVEEWETDKDLERRIRSDQFLKILEVMEFSAATPALRFLFVSETDGLKTVEMIRTAKHRLDPFSQERRLINKKNHYSISG
jgi:quinol monooxygenase YgiN